MSFPRELREPLPAAASGRFNLRLLEVFVQVAQAGSMSAAGESLGISQAAVSQAVTSLEEALGVQLFDRSVRPPALTLVGTSTLQCAREIVARMQQLQDTARYAASGRVPLLRIGMLDSFTSTAGAHALQLLKDVASEWTVASGFRATSLQALLERRSDVIITSDDGPVPEEITASTILTESFLLVVPPGTKADVTDLVSVASELDFIRYGRDSHMGAVIEAHLRRCGVRPTTRYQFDTTDALLLMVAAGFGWTVVTPLILLKSIGPEMNLRVLPLPGPALRRRLLVAMRTGESAEILQRVRDAALSSLREIVQPRIAALLPQLADKFVIAGGVRKARGEGAVGAAR